MSKVCLHLKKDISGHLIIKVSYGFVKDGLVTELFRETHMWVCFSLILASYLASTLKIPDVCPIIEQIKTLISRMVLGVGKKSEKCVIPSLVGYERLLK